VVKKALSKLKDQLSEEEYFLGTDLEGEMTDWLGQAAAPVEGQLAVDVYQTQADIVVKAPVAGVDEANIDITVQPDSISIRGERKEEKEVADDHYHAKECYWGAFSRVVMLPVEGDPEGAKATFKNGILTIRIPKSRKNQAVKLRVNN
jgi:HSP20 family protein